MDINVNNWREEINKRGDIKTLKFRCPVCGNEQNIEDFKKLGIDDATIINVFYYSCIGRFTGAQSMDEKPCNYTSGGLFTFNKLFVIDGKRKIPVFDFAKNPLNKENK